MAQVSLEREAQYLWTLAVAYQEALKAGDRSRQLDVQADIADFALWAEHLTIRNSARRMAVAACGIVASPNPSAMVIQAPVVG